MDLGDEFCLGYHGPAGDATFGCGSYRVNPSPTHGELPLTPVGPVRLAHTVEESPHPPWYTFVVVLDEPGPFHVGESSDIRTFHQARATLDPDREVTFMVRSLTSSIGHTGAEICNAPGTRCLDAQL